MSGSRSTTGDNLLIELDGTNTCEIVRCRINEIGVRFVSAPHGAPTRVEVIGTDNSGPRAEPTAQTDCRLTKPS